MRFLFPLAFVALLGFLAALAASSCELASRDLPEGGPDAEAAPPTPVDSGPEVDTDCGCCSRALPIPMLPYCSGEIAIEIPAKYCTRPCTGSAAYALCQGGCYETCDCNLPAGYTLEDGGFLIETDAGDSGGSGNSGDAHAEAAADSSTPVDAHAETGATSD